MYDIKIIIVTLDFQKGNSLLTKLFNVKIYDFVNVNTYFEKRSNLEIV